MTREEIESGRRALALYREAGVHPERFMHVVDWLLDHATELLSLAEEARWRDVETEPPPTGEIVLGMRQGFGVFEWSSVSSRIADHWRPMPRGPR